MHGQLRFQRFRSQPGRSGQLTRIVAAVTVVVRVSCADCGGKNAQKKKIFVLLAFILIGVDEDEIAKRSNGSVDTNLYYIESVGLNFHRRPTIDSSLGRSNCSLGLFSTPLGVFLSVSSSFLLNRPF